jgi:hypothetical protein
MQKRIVTINGRDYDTRTGLPVVQKVAAPSKHATAHSTVLHQSTQRSQTLNRRFVHNPYASPSQAAPTPQAVAAPQTTPAITKFYREPAKPVSAPRPKTTAVFSDIRPSIPHPTVERAIAKQQHKQAPQAMHTMPKPSDVLKREAIETSLKAAPSHTSREQVKRHKSPKKSKWSFARLATAGATLVLVGAYFTYLNMPSL